jgi:hypothetical protein
VDIAAGFPTLTDNPFKATTEEEWAGADAQRMFHEKNLRAAAEMAANVAKAPAPLSIRELVSVDEGEVDDVRDKTSENATGVQVLPRCEIHPGRRGVVCTMGSIPTYITVQS